MRRATGEGQPVIVVATFPTRSEAELAQGALAAAGIAAELVADDAGGAYPFDLSGGARLLVEESDAADAAAILARGAPPVGESS